MKVVLDTNVLIDGFRDEYSYAKRIINEVIAGRILAYANNQTLRENKFILQRRIDSDEYKQELEDFFEQVIPVENNRRVPKIAYDPEDTKILESAVEAEADYLVTEDRHLLDINKYQNIRIIEPVGLWKIYEEEIGEDPWKKWIKFVSGK